MTNGLSQSFRVPMKLMGLDLSYLMSYGSGASDS